MPVSLLLIVRGHDAHPTIHHHTESRDCRVDRCCLGSPSAASDLGPTPGQHSNMQIHNQIHIIQNTTTGKIHQII